MITETGIWDQETADKGHIFSYYLARWISYYLSKDKYISDLGCGKGTYLGYLEERGFDKEKMRGYEGFNLHNFDFARVYQHDLTTPLNIDKELSGNTICLEVIEHIPNKFSGILFNSIANHTAPQCKAIISCAIPGQGGDGHINCRSNLWVIQRMEKRGFKLLVNDTQNARDVIEEHCKYFRETLLIFERC